MDRVFAHELNRRGGTYLGAAREWLQSNVNGGDQVRWDSGELIHMTVRQFEEAAAVIAAAAINADRSARTSCAVTEWRSDPQNGGVGTPGKGAE